MLPLNNQVTLVQLAAENAAWYRQEWPDSNDERIELLARAAASFKENLDCYNATGGNNPVGYSQHFTADRAETINFGIHHLHDRTEFTTLHYARGPQIELTLAQAPQLSLNMLGEADHRSHQRPIVSRAKAMFLASGAWDCEELSPAPRKVSTLSLLIRNAFNPKLLPGR